VPKSLSLVLVGIIVLSPVAAGADELAQIIQRDLITLGYEPGNTDGEVSVETVIAISKFQAENDLEVTGEPTPRLAGIIKARIRQNNGTALVPGSAGRPPPQADPAALRAAQQSCLQQKMAEAQQAKKKKRGLGSLLRGVTRIADRAIAGDTSRRVSEASSRIYAADATASDLKAAAKDLGLAESDLEECRNP
jgi:peptidoglycan hydrolase-like protein with peptidoglycan-binding domain